MPRYFSIEDIHTRLFALAIMKKLEYGLIANRHNMPVDNFIFNKIKDPTKIRNIEAEAYRKIKTIANEYKCYRFISGFDFSNKGL